MVRNSTRRRKGPSIAIALLLGVMSVGLLVSPASADGVVVAGNQNCAQLIPGSPELRVNAPADGVFTDGTLTVTIDVRTLANDSETGDHPGNQTGSQVFDFTATGGTVIGVVVKGGPDANFYDYRPTGVTSDTGLHAPLGAGPGGSKFFGLSHISFCYVVKASPAIVTQASADITIGGQITDTATLSGGDNPTGTITFNLYGPDDATCSGTAVFTDAATVTGNGDHTSDPFEPTAPGTYRWIASYSGDANNNPVSGACNDANESVVVSLASPAIVTQVSSASITIGGSVTDTATLSGGFEPTGTITFNVYGPDDADCSDTATLVSTETVDGDGDYTSDAFTPTVPGTYRWIASYSGDDNNDPVDGVCNDEGETVVVNQNQPTLATAPWVIPQDDAMLSDLFGAGPFGDLEFELFDNAGCTGDPVFSQIVDVTGNATYSTTNSGEPSVNDGFMITTDGTFYWVVTYTGDAENAMAESACGVEILDVDITP